MSQSECESTRIFRAYANAHPLTADSAGVEQENVRLFLTTKPLAETTWAE